jgi:HK97 family phage portal protein
VNIRDRIAALFARKSNPVAQSIVAVGPGRPIWSEVDVPGLALQGYQRNPYVYRAVNLIAEGVASLPWLAYKPGADGNRTELPDTHPALQLLRAPNPEEWQSAFLKRVVSFILLGGNAYIVKVTIGGAVAELYALRPDRVQLIVGGAKQPVRAYRYEANGLRQELPAETVLHLKTFHPMNDWVGMPVLEAAARSLDQNNEARAHNVALLQNGARPSAIAKAPGELTEPIRKGLKEQLNEAHAGTTNAGKLMLLEAGMELQPWGLSPVDMDWLEGMRQSAREIVSVLGVPPEMVGDTANKTYNSYPEARRAFYQEAVLPWADFIRDALNHSLAPLMGAGLVFGYDRENIEALQEDAAARWKRAIEAKREGIITTNEARNMLGYDDDPTPEADKLLVSPTVMPLGEDSPQLEAAPGDPNADPNADPAELDPEDDPEDPEDAPPEGKAFNLRSARAKGMHWKSTDRQRRRWTRAIRDQVAKRFRAERAAVMKAMGAAANPDAAVTAAIAELHHQRPEWVKLLRATYQVVGEPFARSVLRALKSEARAFRAWDPRVTVFARKADSDLQDVWLNEVQTWIAAHGAERVESISSTTERKLRNALQEHVSAGLSIPDMQAKVDELYLEQIIPHRSEVIARTEVLSASNVASQAAARSTGLPLEKEWIATRDDRTRTSEDSEFDHLEADGQKVAMDQPYTVSGEQLMFPGDSSLGASAGNTIQCRCTEGYHVAGDEAEE